MKTRNKGIILAKMKSLLYSAVFREFAYSSEDLLQECIFCGKRAWSREDVHHSKGCKLGLALDEIARLEVEHES